VAEAAATGRAVVLDARAPGYYSGELGSPKDPRNGHIPGARSAPWEANLTGNGRFGTSADLAARYAGLGVGPDSPVIAYCGSGVTACHDLLVLESLGVHDTALYPGSWSAWSADVTREVEPQSG
jgi:thiosulfate/3-mercaptopyruvate sulfurtransferase